MGSAPVQPTILVVDDNPTNLNLLFENLSEAGFRVLIAIDGTRAVHQAELAQPDAILLDVMMPEIDGFETCRLLKENANTRDIPIIFMTALSDVDSKIKGFEQGAVDYVTKPLKYSEVIARINTHVKVHQLQQALQQKNEELEEALSKVKLLSGLLPICAHCKKIRDDKGYWQDVAVYIQGHSEAEFTHGFCPDCLTTLYPELYPNEEQT